MNNTLNEAFVKMNEKLNDYVNVNFDQLNQNTLSLLTELIKFKEVCLDLFYFFNITS